MKDNQPVLVINYRYTMLSRAVAADSVTATHVTNVLYEPWITPDSTPTQVLTDNGNHERQRFS